MIEVLIVGPGRMGTNYAETLQANEDIKIIGVVEIHVKTQINLHQDLMFKDIQKKL